MRERKRPLLILLFCLNVLKVRGDDHHLKQKLTSSQPLNHSKNLLNVVQGSPVEMKCEVTSFHQDIRWIEWTRNSSHSPVLVKFVNYQAYVDPEFSNRLSVNGNGDLLINSAQIKDSDIYTCTTYTLKNHVATFIHGTSVRLKIQGDTAQGAGATERVQLGFPALIDCKIDVYKSSQMLLAYTWTRNNIDVTIDPRFSVLTSGSMFIRETTGEDAGVYVCVARTLSDRTLPQVYRGREVNLDVLYPPIIKEIKDRVTVPLGNDVYLPCTSQGNPALVSTAWLWNERPLPKILQSKVFSNGTLYIKNIQRNYEGTFKCIPSNEVGPGKPAETLLKVEVLPVFTLIPPKTLTAKLGDNLVLVCRAIDSRITWRKVESSLPEFRTTIRGGSLLISNIRLEDSGTYECKASSVTGAASQLTELIVYSTPIPPAITKVVMFSTSAFISWKPGYNGGLKQTIEIWYRRADSDDHHWKTITRISADVTWYTVYSLEPQIPYLFSLRGVNKAGFGLFSEVFRSETTTLSPNYQKEDKQDKPLAPSNVQLNITVEGYLISWSYSQTPGRPQVQFFLLEFRELNSSLKWKTLESSISLDERQWFIDKHKLHRNLVYEFRIFSFGGEMFSEPAYVVETNIFGSVVPSKSSSDNNIVIVASVVSVSAILLFASFIYCFCIKRRTKNQFPRVTKVERRCRVSLPHSSADSNHSDSENDSYELNDVKLLPSLSTFVSDRQGNESRVHLKKYGRTKYEDFQSVTLGDEYVARAAVTLADKSNVLHSKPAFQQDIIPEYYVESSRSREDMPGRFKSGCLLPEFPELRDSYDQFCTMLSEQSSHEELESMRSIKNNAGEIGTNCSKYCSDEILDNVHSCKHRKKTILEEASDAHEKYQRWSMPEFTKLWYETADSDTESAIISEAGSIKEQCKQFSADQSTQVLTHPISCPNKSNGLVNSSPHATQSSLHVANQACDEVEEQISGTKLSELSRDRSSGNGKVLMKESLSCPAMVSTQSLSNFCASGYDSFDFFEDSRRSSTSPSPTNSCILVENSFYVKNPEDMNECTAKENSSTCEVSVCASDSGYSGMSNGARDSPEGEEQDRYDPLSSNHLDILTEPELFKALKHLQEKYGAQSARDSEENSDISSEDIEPKLLYSVNSFCDTPSKMYLSAFPDVIVEKGVSQEDKDKRCAELMQEYKINKNSYPRTTRNSLYRTYEI